jgi:hypothetical protein
MESVLKENIGQISAKRPATYLVKQLLTFTHISYSDNKHTTNIDICVDDPIATPIVMSCGRKKNAKTVRRMLNDKTTTVSRSEHLQAYLSWQTLLR